MFARQREPRGAFTEYSPVCLEILEDRIAPATLVVGALDNPNDPQNPIVPANTMNYTAAKSTVPTLFVLASASPDPDIQALFSGSTDHYYIDLKARDELSLLSPIGSTSLVSVTAGRGFVFFYDANHNGIVESNEISGMSLAGGSNVRVGVSVNGDVLTNLDARTGDFAMNLISDTQNIVGLSVNGKVSGSILAGGSISKVNVGTVGAIGTGSVGNGYQFDLGGNAPQIGNVNPGKGTLGDLTLAAGKAGPSISGVTADGVDIIEASKGGAGGRGGSISLVTLLSDSDGFVIKAGDGGDGLPNRAGGAGGTVSNVAVKAVAETSPTEEVAAVLGGNGGLGDGSGAGGAGGAVSTIFIGYDRINTSSFAKSGVFLTDRVYIVAGDGGSGGSGGLGGAATNINVRVATAGGPLQSLPVSIFAGDGGDASLSNGRGGAGGSVNNYFIINNEFTQLDAFSSVFGGHGGAGGASGGAGGSVLNGILFSEAIQVLAGAGGDGATSGGLGGSLTSLQIVDASSKLLTQNNVAEVGLKTIFAEAVVLTGGDGGDALVSGRGGNGGSITSVNAPLTDLASLHIVAGMGGKAVGSTLADTGGTGGNGGSINRVVFPSDRYTYEAVAQIAAGDGGDGKLGGGNGGAITAGSQILLTDAGITMQAGDGGSSIAVDGTPASGRGGNGGLVTGVALSASGTFLGGQATISLAAGSGGDGGGKSNAGNGGAITNASAIGEGTTTVSAGVGGDAQTGTVGTGGSLTGIEVIAQFGVATLTAGSAGGLLPGGASLRGAVGGSVVNASVQGPNGAAITAGNGAFGGAGGDIRTAFAGSPVSSSPYPVGDVVVRAGSGSAGAAAGGRGGSLTDVTVVTGSTIGNRVEAGSGGNGGTGAGAIGGSINGLTVRNGGLGGVLTIAAGSGGNSSSVAAGGNGGSVQNIASFVADVQIQSIVAGNGGSTASGLRGSAGGSISNVFVAGDVGVRSGQTYGLTTMGGLFAGAAGGGGSVTTAGLAGSVTNVSAKFIASIAAGTDASPQLATKVDRIFLKGLSPLVPQQDGSFSPTAIAGGNFVGGIADPFVPNASNFHYNVNGTPTSLTGPQAVWDPATSTPVDGLVAALTIGTKNLPFNAWLTRQGSDFIIVSGFNKS